MLKSKIKFILPFLLIIALYLAVPLYSQAASPFGGLVPCGNSNQDPCTVNDFLIGIARITNFLISVAGLYAIYNIVSAGFWLVVSSGDTEAIKKNQQWISAAIIGMVLVFLAYLFVATVTNGILAQGNPCKKIDLTNPISYIKAQESQACLDWKAKHGQ